MTSILESTKTIMDIDIHHYLGNRNRVAKGAKAVRGVFLLLSSV